MQINVKKINPNARLPEYQTGQSAGADLYACLEEDMTIKPFEIALVPTGISIELPAGYEAQIRPRSGLGLKGLTLPNSPGTIDADYRGEIKVIIQNLGKTDFVIHNLDRIAQMVIARYEHVSFAQTETLSETTRGSGGFGSTGIS